MSQSLHLVSFDIPFPANYGGVIDVFYKIKALHAQGAKIILHCFQYKEKRESEELNTYCERVIYYKRNLSLFDFFAAKPFIVKSRKNEILIENLCKDEFPILFEGVHSTYFLNDKRLENRAKFIRLHNIEHRYYRGLANYETNIFKKIFFYVESLKLKVYESKMQAATALFTIATEDQAYFSKQYNQAVLVPAFHANNAVESIPGMGTYALYQGNLSINENEEAVLWLLKEVFSKTDYPLIVAGKQASETLKAACNKHKQVTLIENPSDEEMHKLTQEAQINLVYSMVDAGLKIKLLNVLFQGRYCVANSKSIVNTGLASCIEEANTSKDFVEQINTLKLLPFDIEKINARKAQLANKFNNQESANSLLSYINKS